MQIKELNFSKSRLDEHRARRLTQCNIPLENLTPKQCGLVNDITIICQTNILQTCLLRNAFKLKQSLFLK